MYRRGQHLLMQPVKPRWHNCIAKKNYAAVRLEIMQAPMNMGFAREL